MCNLRKAMAILLVLVLSLSFAISASAAGAGSPSEAPTSTATTEPTPTPTPEPEWDRHVYIAADKTDTYFPVDGTVVGYEIADTGATLINVNSPKANGRVTADEAKNGEKKLVSITQIGSGTYGIGQVKNGIKEGQNVTALTVSSDQKVTIVANAFKKTRINTITFNGNSIAIKANAFKGSTAKTIVISALNVATCDNLQLNKKAFNGLKKVTIQVSKTTMSTAEYKKLKAKMKKKYGKNFGKSVVLKRV